MCVFTQKRNIANVCVLPGQFMLHFFVLFLLITIYLQSEIWCVRKSKHTQKPHTHTQTVTWNSRFPSNNYFSPVIKSVFYNRGQLKHIKTFCGIVWAGFVLCLCWLLTTCFYWTLEWVKENQKGFAYPTAVIIYYENSCETKTVLVTWRWEFDGNCFCRISHFGLMVGKIIKNICKCLCLASKR